MQNESLDKIDIYETLLSELVDLKFMPGEFLKESELSARFNISRTPLREVIKRLALEGYIQVIPRHGNKVTLIDADSVRQMVEMRIVLETRLSKQLSLCITAAQKAELHGLLDRQQEAISEDNGTDFWLLDNRFHQRIFEMADKSIWWDTIRMHEPHYMRFRRLEMTDNTNYELLFVHHKNILKNIEERRIEDIEATLTSHIGHCLERLPILIDKYPQCFSGR